MDTRLYDFRNNVQKTIIESQRQVLDELRAELGKAHHRIQELQSINSTLSRLSHEASIKIAQLTKERDALLAKLNK